MDILYSPTMCLVKLTVLVQIGQVFATTGKRLFFFLLGLSIAIIMFYTTTMLFRILACIPRAKIWDPATKGKCFNSDAAITSSAALNVVIDFILLLVPIERTWRLQMPMKRKIAVSAVFATGFL